MVELAGNAKRHREIEMANPQDINALHRRDGIGILRAIRRFDLAEERRALIGAGQFLRHRSRAHSCHAPRRKRHAALARGKILHAVNDGLGFRSRADHGDHEPFRPHVAGTRHMWYSFDGTRTIGAHIGRLEIADGALHRFETEARMLHVEQRELAPRRLQDVADAGRRELHDEMAEFERLVPGHLLQFVTRHFSTL